MAVKVDFGKTDRVETNEKLTQITKSTSDKKAENSNVFRSLLNELKSKESSGQVSNLRNKPASSEVVKHDHHRSSKNPDAVRGLNSENVNNLAASALIALAAIASGQNRIGGLHCAGGRRTRSAWRDFRRWRVLRIDPGSRDQAVSRAGNRHSVRSFRIERKRSGGDRL